MNSTLSHSVLEAPPSLRHIESTFTTFDGLQLFYRAWLPEGPAERAVIFFHRGHEHSGRWRDSIDALDLANTACFAFDARGHGQSPGERGWAPDFSTYIKDAEAFAHHIVQHHEVDLSHTSVIAHSVGAVIAAAWLHDCRPPIRSIVLAAPAFDVKLYIPFALPALRLFNRFRPGAFVKSYVKSRMLTHDPDEATKYDEDPLIHRQIAVNILLALRDTSRRLIHQAHDITTPTLLLGAGSDWVVKNSAIRKFFQRLASPNKQLHIYPRQGHSLFHETQRDEVIETVRDFLISTSHP